MDTEQSKNNNANEQKSNDNKNLEVIMDLPKLSFKTNITNSDIMLAIFEICTFNKKYNYECSNNTKAFWDRVVDEGILKKIFKNFKSETLRKYWKIIRQSGDNEKFMEIIRNNENFINNNNFKLLPIINGISTYITSPPKDQTFEEYFNSTNTPKEKKVVQKDENASERKERRVKTKKEEKEEKEESDKEDVDPRILEMDETINKLMKITNRSREEVFRALQGCTGNIKYAYLYLMDSTKYEKYFFYQTDDYIIKNLKNKHYYLQLLNTKGEDYVKEREKFLKKHKN